MLMIVFFIFGIKLLHFLNISRSLAEFSRIPIVVTNQVRSQIRDEACQYSFQGRIVWSNCEILHMNYECNISYSAVQNREKALHEHTECDSHLVAALGIHWAHAVTIRLVLDSKSGLYAWTSKQLYCHEAASFSLVVFEHAFPLDACYSYVAYPSLELGYVSNPFLRYECVRLAFSFLISSQICQKIDSK